MTKGWPAVIVCSAKNESQYDYWSEVQSRFIVSSPNMIPEKYREGNKIIGMREGMTDSLQQKLIISDDETLVAKECVGYLINRIKKMCIRKVEERKNLVWIPYTELLAASLPADRGTDNRMTTRLYTFLKIVALARAHLRKKLICGSETMIIADIKEDLHEALHLTQKIVGIPIFKMEMTETVVAVYRNLRENYEYRLRYRESGQFFVREMELQRIYGTDANGEVKKHHVRSEISL
ncbi:MAG: hypothetical protein GEU26_12985 [Nitrososphaeraceae archaeon]|nr:hypothetical protein [Nitrososphaeraceae archaeon]